ncbi:uncharacterized protein YGR130C-like [Trichogramma pretiosum]|uniref:uncharacterized protein YGR130C-like n=1 Tax=Trichogramma pretiosum TaxID=7493 RepID=UPI0006C9B60B|nr:uncharacterized protein YGR130C-like [Trichogramma pretiosum]XP_014237952.1 uncharacterized protein YGR130C-like [Trichogramma pretiosum]XP_014237953.1 uncharacterized protein YGR130C-like [Trichogramma pretiosum]
MASNKGVHLLYNLEESESSSDESTIKFHQISKSDVPMPCENSNENSVDYKKRIISLYCDKDVESETESENSFELIDEPKQNFEEPANLEQNDLQSPKHWLRASNGNETVTAEELLRTQDPALLSKMTLSETQEAFMLLCTENSGLKKVSAEHEAKWQSLERQNRKLSDEIAYHKLALSNKKLQQQDSEGSLIKSEVEETSKPSSHKYKIQSQTKVAKNNETNIDSNNQYEASAVPKNSETEKNSNNSEITVSELKDTLTKISKDSERYQSLVIQLKSLSNEITSYKERNQMIMVHEGIDRILKKKLDLLYHSSIASNDSPHDILKLKDIAHNYNGKINRADKDYLISYINSVYPEIKLDSTKIWETAKFTEKRLIETLLQESLQICTNREHHSSQKEIEKYEGVVKDLRHQLKIKSERVEKELLNNQEILDQYEKVYFENDSLNDEISKLQDKLEKSDARCPRCNNSYLKNGPGARQQSTDGGPPARQQSTDGGPPARQQSTDPLRFFAIAKNSVKRGDSLGK